MWLLSLLPDSLLYGFILSIMGIGAALFVFGTFAVFLPLVKGYGMLMRTIGTLLLIGSVYLYGGYGTEMKWRKVAAELKADMDRKVALSEKNSKQIVTKYITQTKVIKEKGDAIKKLSQHVKEADAKCIVPKSFVVLHDSAAKNEIPDTSKGVDGTSSGVNLSSVGETVSINYNNYHQLSERLKALQDWVAQQEKIYNGK
jgi:ABC-type nickel/cobalt efflux system permease component RcnA